MEPNTTTTDAGANTTNTGVLTTDVGAAPDKGAVDKGVQAPGQADKGKTPEGSALTGSGAETPEQKAAAEKAKADAAAKGTGEVEVKWGELQVSPELSGKFKATAKDLGLDSAKAQKVADLYVEAQKAGDAALQQQLVQQDKKWVETLKADKEIGGANFNESVMNARKALTKFGTPELSKLIDAAGLSNNPEFVRVFARVGKSLAEDNINGTNGNSGAAKSAQDEANARLQRAYPSMFNPDGSPKASGDRKATS